MKPTLKTLTVAAAVTLTYASVVQAEQAQPDAAPATEAEIAASPAVKRLKELLEVVNSGDAARIKTYVEAAAARPGPGPVAALRDLHRRSHGLDLVRVVTAKDNGTVAVVRNRLTGDEEALSLDVEPQGPHRITGMGEAPFEPAAPVPASEQAQLRQLGSYLKKLGDAEVFSGVVVIARGGKPIFSQAYGYADRDKKIANTVDTPFLLGSMNKLFTGLAIGRLVEQGKLSYEDPLSKFVPDFPDAQSAQRIKIKHLLSHTSGLSSFNPSFSPPGDRTVTVKTILDSVQRQPPQFEPGTKWSYSNTGIQLLGRVIEVVTGQDYYEYVRKNVYRRGGMKRDPFPDYSRGAIAMAQPYEIEWDETRPRWANRMAVTARRGGPAGGGIASAPDLIRLANAMNAGRIVKPETLRLHASAKPELATQHYGYAFSVRARMAKRPLVGHGGNAPGQCTEYGALADTPYTIVVLSNLTSGTCMSVTGKILQVLQPTKTPAAEAGGERGR
jgi:CubicO group peptidase (beta-lactamase class C family)